MLLLALSPAHADTIYKCSGANGSELLASEGPNAATQARQHISDQQELRRDLEQLLKAGIIATPAWRAIAPSSEKSFCSRIHWTVE